MNTNSDDHGGNRISTALLLAAGTGTRLLPLTSNSPKCLTLVNEKSILERLVNNLKRQEFKRLVIITGYEKECIMDFLGTKSGDIEIEYIHSPCSELLTIFTPFGWPGILSMSRLSYSKVIWF